MNKVATLFLFSLFGAGVAGCQEQDIAVQLRSLANSGDVSYVCRTSPGGLGVPLSECHRAAIAGGTRDLYALLTQQSTGEVAIINVPLTPSDPRADEGVVDVDPAGPGFGFLRVGARPGEVVSTPGGQASFVAVAETGKPGIFALPTTCLSPPAPNETVRDLTTWPACSLPRAPGSLEIVVEPPSEDGTIYEACDRSLGPQAEEPASSQRPECAANLSTEAGPMGRRKLMVALPDAGSVAVIDAQWLLDRPPGSFQPCLIEAEYPLQVQLPAVPPEQQLPEDLQPAPGCEPQSRPVPPSAPVFTARPSDFALGGEVLYVADDAAPVVHQLDVTNPCAAVERPPLLPRSLEQPKRIVTTSQVAVSPETPSGRRFVYAVDFEDQPLPSLMAFDVSPGSTDRTPIVRAGASFVPGETPDRTRFSGTIRDITFIERERLELDPETGTAIVGTACNPNPIPGAPGTEYQPSASSFDGARAEDLRGIFALVLLSNGQISFVDVEDFDAPCRRPAEINPLPEMDFRGCFNDQPAIPGLERYAYGTETPSPVDDLATVTDEVSCRMVQPHRQRSAYLGITSNSAGIRAPALRNFPQLNSPEIAGATALLAPPKLLAVDFPAPGGGAQPARVYVGTSLYRSDVGDQFGSSLVIDPAVAEQYSVSLPFVEPRAYLGETVLVTYEGALTGRTSAFLLPNPDGNLTLTDPTLGFCDAGVNDLELMRERGERQFALSGPELDAFAERHTDHVAITAAFPEEDDSYWAGAACEIAECDAVFGDFDAEVLAESRKFQVLDAEQDKLVLSSRVGVRADLTKCCFPEGSQYEIRPSAHWIRRGSETGVQHDVIASWTDASGSRALECVRDCSPRKRWHDSRVFEITCPPDSPQCGAGVTVEGDACELLTERQGGARPSGVELDEPAAQCIYDTPTARFALYRGAEPTLPGSFFSWSVAGGFLPLGLDLSGLSVAVLPKAAVSLPELDWFTVIDSSSLGLVLIDLDGLSVLTPSIN